MRLRPGGPGPFACKRSRRRRPGPGQGAGARAGPNRGNRPGDPGRPLRRPLYVEAFARLYPERVAGLVYVNGVTSNARDDPRLIADLEAERRMANASVTVARLGLAPLVADKLVADSDAPADAAAASAGPSPVTPAWWFRGIKTGRWFPAWRGGQHRRRGDARDPDRGDHQHLERAGSARGRLAGVEERARPAPPARWILQAPGTTHVSPSPATTTTSTRRWGGCGASSVHAVDVCRKAEKSRSSRFSEWARGDRGAFGAVASRLCVFAAKVLSPTPMFGIDAQGSAGGSAGALLQQLDRDAVR